MSFLRRRELWWSVWVVGALLMLALARPTLYGVVVPLSAVAVDRCRVLCLSKTCRMAYQSPNWPE